MTDPADPSVKDPIVPGGNDDQTDKRPSYETHQRLLSEKKAVQEKAARLEAELAEHRQRMTALDAEKADADRKRLEDKEQFKELYQRTSDDLKAKEKIISDLVKTQTDSRKMASFLDAIKAEIPRQYWGLVDVDQIVLDGDKVDEFSVQKYVETFRETYKDIVKPRETRKMPMDSASPDDSATTLTYAQWMQLPAKEKEKKINLVK